MNKIVKMQSLFMAMERLRSGQIFLIHAKNMLVNKH